MSDASARDASGVDASGAEASGVDASGAEASGVDASAVDTSAHVTATAAGRASFWDRLPEGLRPLEHERRGRGDLRRIESTLLALAFVLLAVAVVNDVVLSTHTAARITADLRTYRALTGHEQYHNISVEQDLVHHTTRDVLCGNIAPGPPGELPQICLIMTGPVLHGVRASHGGFYLPPQTPDKRVSRYGCFGSAVPEDLCAAPIPPGALHSPVPGADG